MGLTNGVRSLAPWLRAAPVSPGAEPARATDSDSRAEPATPTGAPIGPSGNRRSSASRRAQTPRRRLAATGPEPGSTELPAQSRYVRIMLVEDVPQVVERVRELLRSQTTYRLVAVTIDGRRVEDDVAEHRPDVVLVDTLLQGRVKGPAVIERLRRARTPLPCVAITVSDRPLSEAVEKSVDAVVTLPFGTFDLIRAIRDGIAAGATRNPTLASRVVAIFSAKGGVGKTTIAYNLAVAMAQMGLRTALVDGSLQYGDVRRLLRVADDLPSICDLPTDSVRSSDLSELMVADPSGIEVLLAPPRLEMADLITTRDLDKILDMLRRTYNAIVIDTSSSLGEATLAMLDAADVIIQVIAPETAALDVTRLAAEAFSGIGYPETKLRLLLNRADTQGAVSRSQLRRAFGRDPDYVIGSDWSLVTQSNAEGIPFVLASPDAAISEGVRGVASQIASFVGAAPREAAPRRSRAGRG